jgi:hypothetical protein
MARAHIVPKHQSSRTARLASEIAGALELLNGHDVSAAVLDCNLGDEYVWPVADRLAAIHVPLSLAPDTGGPAFRNASGVARYSPNLSL